MAKNTRLNSLTVEAIRAVAYKEAADAGADVITVEWVARRLTKSKKWVRENWVRSYGQVLEGDIWIPGGIDEGIRKRQSTDVHRSERVKKLMQTVLVKPLMELTEFNRPMPFIETNPDGTFQINDLARRALLANERPVCIVAIVGKYRTGKSFLMNRLYGRNSGFPLGGTIESETKGIWIWQRQHPQDPSKTLVLMDTEGLFDVKKGDSTHDMKLFTLAVLLSSCFVYNIQSTIDEALIQQLHLVSQLTEHIKTKNTRQEETGAEFSKYFPPFVLLVRDFFLELKIGQQACTPDEYLENSLAYKPGHSKDIKKYNEPRQCIKEFFTRRKCFVLPKPVEDDNKIRNLEKVTEGDLRPEFLLKADEAVRSILHQAVTFRVQENPVTGHSFAELADVYVNAMNTGQVPCIESAVSLLRESECHKAKDLAIASYVQQMTEQACGLMPMEAEDLSKRHRQAMEESAKLFRKKALFDEEGKFVKELLDDINILSQEFVRQNESESSLLCKRQLDLYYSGIDEKIASSYYNKQGGYEEYKEDCTMVNAKYASLYNKGPMAQTELSNYLKQREGVGHTIMNADKALSEKARELEKLEVEREHQYLVAEAERERNEALRQEMEDEKRNHQQLVSQYMEDMDRRFAEQLENHQKAIKEMTRRYVCEQCRLYSNRKKKKKINFNNKVKKSKPTAIQCPFCTVHSKTNFGMKQHLKRKHISESTGQKTASIFIGRKSRKGHKNGKSIPQSLLEMLYENLSCVAHLVAKCKSCGSLTRMPCSSRGNKSSVSLIPKQKCDTKEKSVHDDEEEPVKEKQMTQSKGKHVANKCDCKVKPSTSKSEKYGTGSSNNSKRKNVTEMKKPGSKTKCVAKKCDGGVRPSTSNSGEYDAIARSRGNNVKKDNHKKEEKAGSKRKYMDNRSDNDVNSSKMRKMDHVSVEPLFCILCGRFQDQAEQDTDA